MNRSTLVIGSVAVMLTAAWLVAGPLTPPVGPIASTYKTLQEVEPRIAINATNTPGDVDSLFKITQPGSYYLTGNMTGVAGFHGIEIASSGVSLDLCGHRMIGVAGSLDGINAGAIFQNCAIRNGSIAGWGDDGVGGQFNSTIIEGLTLNNNGMDGIRVTAACTIRNCAVLGHGDDGIQTSSNCTIESCQVALSTNHGIETDQSLVRNCATNNNITAGIRVNAGMVIQCISISNPGDGILALNNCMVEGNTCSSNGLGAGIFANIHVTGSGNRIVGNHCTGADRGVDVDIAGNFIIRNTCSGNSTDWDIAANNVFGAIVDRQAPASGAVFGFAAASTLGTTDPDANFSY